MKIFFTILMITITSITFGQTKKLKDPVSFIPKGYVLFEKVLGDLNMDGEPDCVLIIKDTDKTKIINDENRGKLDRNRRGIIVLFKKNDQYELVTENYNCFSSENEDGGVYFPPELSVEIMKGKLYVTYAHGRYGYWGYTFRYQDSAFALIGYDESNGGAVISSEISINFLTKIKRKKININESAQGGDEVFKKTSQTIKSNKVIKLSEIKDFDELKLWDL